VKINRNESKQLKLHEEPLYRLLGGLQDQEAKLETTWNGRVYEKTERQKCAGLQQHSMLYLHWVNRVWTTQ
jgi:hypothetical protein